MLGLRLLPLALVVLAGCSRTFSGVAVQPNPVVKPTETLRESEKITIVRGDMQLRAPNAARESHHLSDNKYPLLNEAQFTMVSRDRLRFHVQIDHKWEEYADLNTWEVRLVDDKGHVWYPEAIEHAKTRVITKMWDREQRSTVCDRKGRADSGECFTTIDVRNDGWMNRQTLGSVSVFRGRADFVFYQRDLMTANVRSLKLIVKRSGEAFEFTWRFQDNVAAQ